jgi:hypothetical protein
VRCLYRGAWCKVTSWTDAPISWPRVLPAGGRSHPGLLVTTELRRAIRTESAEALKHWFGISTLVAWKLRRRAGVLPAREKTTARAPPPSSGLTTTSAGPEPGGPG